MSSLPGYVVGWGLQLSRVPAHIWAAMGNPRGRAGGEQEFRDPPKGVMECRVGEVRVGGGLYSANGYILVSPVPLEQRLLQAGDRGHLPALPQRAAAVDPGGRLPQGVLLGLRHGQQQGGLCLRRLDGERQLSAPCTQGAHRTVSNYPDPFCSLQSYFPQRINRINLETPNVFDVPSKMSFF